MKKFLISVALIVAIAEPTSAQRLAPGTGGSVPLNDVMALAAKYPNLVTQIRLQLLAAGLKKERVACTADRYSNEWQHLGGARVAPYVCAIGKRTLRLTSVATYYDRNGYRVKANDPAVKTKTVRVVESGLKWQWQ